MSQSQTTNTTFSESDKQQYWYVELPPNRPTRRSVSRKRWIEIVDRLIERDDKGNPVMHTLDGCISVEGDDTAEWKDILRRTVFANGFRMFWEPKLPRKRRQTEASLW